MVLGILPEHTIHHVPPSHSTCDEAGTDPSENWPAWARALWFFLGLVKRALEGIATLMEVALYWYGVLYADPY